MGAILHNGCVTDGQEEATCAHTLDFLTNLAKEAELTGKEVTTPSKSSGQAVT